MSNPTQLEEHHEQSVDAFIARMVAGSDPNYHTIAHHLKRIPEHLLKLIADHGTRIMSLEATQQYRDVSPVLRRIGAGVDDWPVPAAALFVVEERTVYLRSASPMSIIHEVGHAVDAALGGGVYLSGVDRRIRRAFAEARRFVTPYAASDLAEYWAECFRAMLDTNDPLSLWPRATRVRLKECDPTMYAYMTDLFEKPALTQTAVA